MMPKYAYHAVDPHGAQVSGTADATTLAAARLGLVQSGLRISRIEPQRSFAHIEILPARIKASELMHLSRQLSAFLRAGIPILDAIGILDQESDSVAVRRTLAAVGDDLRSGTTLIGALDRHPKDFPEWYRGILRSAELTGRLDEVLDQLSVYIERDVETRKKVTSAMIYPVIVAAMALITIVVLSVFVLPKFETFFASLDAELPWPTRALLGTTRFLTHWWWLLAAGLAAVVSGSVLGSLTRPGKRIWHRTVLVMPVIGGAVRYTKIERFTRLLAAMVSAGVPLPDAMSVATSALKNVIFENALERVREAMQRGDGLAQPIAACGLFPGVASQMIRVGEETGSLDQQLEIAARYYERELGYKINKVTSIIEPAVIIVMGSVVGFVAIALVSAMYGIFRSVHV